MGMADELDDLARMIVALVSEGYDEPTVREGLTAGEPWALALAEQGQIEQSIERNERDRVTAWPEWTEDTGDAAPLDLPATGVTAARDPLRPNSWEAQQARFDEALAQCDRYAEYMPALEVFALVYAEIMPAVLKAAWGPDNIDPDEPLKKGAEPWDALARRAREDVAKYPSYRAVLGKDTWKVARITGPQLRKLYRKARKSRRRAERRLAENS